jgi:hypothetical protein
MNSRAALKRESDEESRKDSAAHQLHCAQQVVNFLFGTTGLSTILHDPPAVIVGAGNWISFAGDQPLSSDAVLGLVASSGELAFIPDFFDRRGKARSKTSPSLHLTNLDSGEILSGHVDAHYWLEHPLAHAGEFFRKKTVPPSALLKRLQDRA